MSLRIRYLPITFAVVAAAAALPGFAQSEASVTVALGAREVFVGEPFVLQIQVTNGGQIAPPDLSGLSADFAAEYVGDSQTSRQQIATVNGRLVRQQEVKYLLNYRLVALREGDLEFPSFTVTAGGETFTTQPQTIRARPPQDVDGFGLTCEFSKESCYVGEPVVLTTTVYIGERVSALSLSMPLLTSSHFQCEPLDIVTLSNREYLKVPVNGKEAIAEKGEARSGGRQFLTLTFKHLVVPTEAGALSAPNGTASIDVPSGSPRRSLLDGLSVFGSQVENRRIVIPSNDIALDVKPLPDAGRPANFSGLVGRYRISTKASPTEVNVGDPITLEVTLEGSYYLKHFDLPSLETQAALAEQFKIPEEMAAGRMEGDRKIFTQTIRAEAHTVTEIPPIEIPYFDAESGTYAVASSSPIPLQVHETNIVDAGDAEEYNSIVETSALTSIDAGIAHNFSASEMLQNQRFGPNIWLRTVGSWLLLLLPPLTYAALAGTLLFKRYHGVFSIGRDRQQAFARLEEALAAEDDSKTVYDRSLDALRTYLGKKLHMNESALTYADAQPALAKLGAGEESLAALKSIFETCEAHRYAGGTPAADAEARFLDSVRSTVRTLDGEIS